MNYVVSFESRTASYTVRFKARNMAHAKNIVDGLLFTLDGIITEELAEADN
jgi:hypothetical protein